MKNPAMNGAIVAHWGRTLLWIVLVLMVAPAAYSQPTGRLNAPDPTLTPIGQEADSLDWDLAWEPGIIRGSSPTGYEWQVDVDDDPVGFEGSHLDLEGSVGPDARSAQFRSLRTCGDTLWIHARVRAVGDWTVQGERVTATPWGSVTAVWAPPCENLPPGAPEPSLDTVPPDTTDLDLAVLDLRCEVQPVGYRSANLPADPTIQTQADLRTMSGTGAEWGSRRTLLLDGEAVAEVDMQHGGWTDSARFVRLGSGFTLPERGLEPGPDYAVRFEIDADDSVLEPDEGNNSLTVACPEVS